MEQHPRPLDMPQEGVAKAGPRASPLDEPRHVGHRDPANVGRIHLSQVEHPEVRLERRERVVGDLRRGRRQSGKQ